MFWMLCWSLTSARRPCRAEPSWRPTPFPFVSRPSSLSPKSPRRSLGEPEPTDKPPVFYRQHACECARVVCIGRACAPVFFERRRVRPLPFVLAQEARGRCTGGRTVLAVQAVHSCECTGAFRRIVAAFSLRRRAALSLRHLRRSVSRLPAGGRSASGRCPDAARVRVCETRPQAPHPAPPS